MNNRGRGLAFQLFGGSQLQRRPRSRPHCGCLGGQPRGWQNGFRRSGQPGRDRSFVNRRHCRRNHCSRHMPDAAKMDQKTQGCHGASGNQHPPHRSSTYRCRGFWIRECQTRFLVITRLSRLFLGRWQVHHVGDVSGQSPKKRLILSRAGRAKRNLSGSNSSRHV